MVCCCMVFVNLSIEPFMDSEQNLLSLFCHTQLATTLFMGLMLKASTLDPAGDTSTAVFNLLICLQVRTDSARQLVWYKAASVLELVVDSSGLLVMFFLGELRTTSPSSAGVQDIIFGLRWSMNRVPTLGTVDECHFVIRQLRDTRR